MLKVTREQQGNTLVLHLSGDINETANFAKDLGETAPDTVLNCKEISRINSVGVKTWVHYFQACAQKGTKLRFVECSPAIVEQLNLISNFSCGGKVESIYVPFACTGAGCKKAFVGLFKTQDLRNSGFELPAVKCKICGAEAIFDDLPEEYFLFASR